MIINIGCHCLNHQNKRNNMEEVTYYGNYIVLNEKVSLKRPYYQDYPRKKKKRHKKVFNETLRRFGQAMKSIEDQF